MLQKNVFRRTLCLKLKIIRMDLSVFWGYRYTGTPTGICKNSLEIFNLNNWTYVEAPLEVLRASLIKALS